MNKKDVLGLWSAAGNVQKMESMPHIFSVLEMLKIRHSTGQGQGGILAVLLLSDKVLTGADNS